MEEVNTVLEQSSAEFATAEELITAGAEVREVMDLCLKFPDEATATSVLMEGEQQRYRHVDIIGVIYKASGSTIVLEDGTEAPEMVAVSGWHVNVRVMPDEDLLDLEPFAVNPEPVTPVRVWM